MQPKWKWVLWAALGGLFVGLFTRTPRFVPMRPSQAYFDRDEYWGDL